MASFQGACSANVKPSASISNAGKPKRMLIRRLRPRVLAIVDTLDTLHNGCGVQGFGWTLPWRKLDHLSPRHHIRAEQFPPCSHAHAESLGRQNERLAFDVVWRAPVLFGYG